MGANRLTDLVARAGIVILGLAIVFALLVLTGPTWPTLFVAMAAVVVALVNGQTQRRLAEQQTRLTTTLQRLTLVPVITGGQGHRKLPNGKTLPCLLLRNVGKGPAYDLRGTVFGMPDPKTGKPRFDAMVVPISESHLAPRETAHFEPTDEQRRALTANPTDIWTVHCADMMGKPHYHAWCNWTREDAHKDGEPWILETVERSPEMIRRNCVVCSGQAEAHSDPPSEP